MFKEVRNFKFSFMAGAFCVPFTQYSEACGNWGCGLVLGCPGLLSLLEREGEGGGVKGKRRGGGGRIRGRAFLSSILRCSLYKSMYVRIMFRQ